MRVLPKVLILKLVLLNHIIIQRATDIVSCRHIDKAIQKLWVISDVWSTLLLWDFVVETRKSRESVRQKKFLSWNVFERWCVFLAENMPSHNTLWCEITKGEVFMIGKHNYLSTK